MIPVRTRTEWFSGDLVPYYEGVYEREYSTGYAIKALWEKGRWGQPVSDCSQEMPSVYQNLPWRGLTSPFPLTLETTDDLSNS